MADRPHFDGIIARVGSTALCVDERPTDEHEHPQECDAQQMAIDDQFLFDW
jgi:hypothetical protein